MSHNHGTKPKWVGVTRKSGTLFIYKAVLVLFRPQADRQKTTIYNSGTPRNSSLSTKVKRFAIKACLRVHGRRPQCNSRQCKSPPLNVSLLSECQWSASSLKDSGISIQPRFATIPSPVIRYLINDFGKIVGYLTLSPQAHALVANLLTLIPTLIKVKRNLPSAPFSESHRRQLSITRFARLNKQRSGDLSLFRSAPKS